LKKKTREKEEQKKCNYLEVTAEVAEEAVEGEGGRRRKKEVE